MAARETAAWPPAASARGRSRSMGRQGLRGDRREAAPLRESRRLRRVQVRARRKSYRGERGATGQVQAVTSPQPMMPTRARRPPVTRDVPDRGRARRDAPGCARRVDRRTIHVVEFDDQPVDRADASAAATAGRIDDAGPHRHVHEGVSPYADGGRSTPSLRCSDTTRDRGCGSPRPDRPHRPRPRRCRSGCRPRRRGSRRAAR